MRSPRTTVLVNLCVAIAVTDVSVVTMEIIDLESKVSVCHLEQTIDTVIKYFNYIKKKSQAWGNSSIGSFIYLSFLKFLRFGQFEVRIA